MRIHSFFQALFVLLLLFYLGMYGYIWFITGHWPDFITIETARATGVRTILTQWLSVPVEGKNLFFYAHLNTWTDFLWILAYVGVLVMISYNLMQKEKNPVWNDLLRFTMLLAVIAGLLDVLEDIVLLYDMYSFSPAKRVVSARWYADPKWVIIGFILAVWALSLLIRMIRGKKKYYYYGN